MVTRVTDTACTWLTLPQAEGEGATAPRLTVYHLSAVCDSLMMWRTGGPISGGPINGGPPSYVMSMRNRTCLHETCEGTQYIAPGPLLRPCLRVTGTVTLYIMSTSVHYCSHVHHDYPCALLHKCTS